MRKLALVLLWALAGCGEPKVIYECECEVTCDGETISDEEEGCGREDDAQEAIDEVITACEENLGAQCGTYSCQCNCDRTDELCNE